MNTKLSNQLNILLMSFGQPWRSQQEISEIAEAGLPETPEQVLAQYDDMLNPSTKRDVVFVGANTVNQILSTDDVCEVIEESGTLYTTNNNKFEKYIYSITDDTRAELLGFNQSKNDILNSGIDPIMIIVKNGDGVRLYEEATIEPDAVVNKYKKQGYEHITAEFVFDTIKNRITNG